MRKTTTGDTRLRVALLIAGAVFGIHCASGQAGQRFLDPNMDFGAIKTVIVMPFNNLSRETAAAERVRDVFSNTLLATGAVAVVPPGDVQAAISRAAITTPTTPTADDVVKIGKALKADAVVTGTVREYGEVRSGSSSGNIISVAVQMLETTGGKLVWSASSTKGGVSMADRLLGSTGAPMNEVTERAVDDLLNKLFK